MIKLIWSCTCCLVKFNFNLQVIFSYLSCITEIVYFVTLTLTVWQQISDFTDIFHCRKGTILVESSRTMDRKTNDQIDMRRQLKLERSPLTSSSTNVAVNVSFMFFQIYKIVTGNAVDNCCNILNLCMISLLRWYDTWFSNPYNMLSSWIFKVLHK